MLAKFYDSLKKKEDNKKLPKSVAKIINSNAPKGFSVYYDESLRHIIVAPSLQKNTSLKIKFDIDPHELSDLPEWAKKDNKSLMDYLYRTQSSLKVSNASIETEDGKEIKFKDLIQDPLGVEQKIVNQKIEVFPDPFPKPEPINFQLKDGRVIPIYFKREPYDKNDQVKFHNISNKALDIILYISDGKNNTNLSTMQVTVKPQSARSVSEAAEALNFFKEYIDGTIKINGVKITKKFIDGKYYDLSGVNEQTEYWNNLKKLEDMLKVEFDPSKTLSQREYVLYNQLVYCLIENKVLELESPLRFITVSKEALQDHNFKENLKKRNGLALAFITSNEKLSLLGINFTLASANVMKDIIFDKVEETREGGNIYIVGAHDNQTWFLYKKYVKPNESSEKVLLELQQQYISRAKQN